MWSKIVDDFGKDTSTILFKNKKAFRIRQILKAFNLIY